MQGGLSPLYTRPPPLAGPCPTSTSAIGNLNPREVQGVVHGALPRPQSLLLAAARGSTFCPSSWLPHAPWGFGVRAGGGHTQGGKNGKHETSSPPTQAWFPGKKTEGHAHPYHNCCEVVSHCLHSLPPLLLLPTHHSARGSGARPWTQPPPPPLQRRRRRRRQPEADFSLALRHPVVLGVERPSQAGRVKEKATPRGLGRAASCALSTAASAMDSFRAVGQCPPPIRPNLPTV